ncbi:hypothetical protein AB0M54_16690 [Actinoplanes sp. NPDC051470]|uniref:hypothetical protein n=1 Tax=unclassified Actinoplanes TaxID=2626549 RepID=UPI00344AE41B
MTSLVTDIGTVFGRELRPTLRQPFTIIISMVQPLVFLGLFAPLLPDIEGGALQWFVPGIVVMSCLFATSRSRPARMSGCWSPRCGGRRC